MRLILILIWTSLVPAANARWVSAGRPVARPLTVVSAPASASVWVAGEDAAVFRLAAPSGTWIPQNLPESGTVTGMAFFDADAGFASVGGYQGARTSNGGANWNPVTIVQDDLGLGPPQVVGPLAATGMESAWTIARWGDYTDLLHTQNGETWSSVRYTNRGYHAPNSIYSLAFVDDTTGWLAGSRINELERFEPVLLRTSNGGANWQVFSAPESVLNGTVEPDWSMQVVAVSESEAWLHVNDPDRSSGMLFYLRNTGTSAWEWTTRTVPFSAATSAFLNARNGWLLGASTWQTIDGAVTFRETPHPDGGIFTDASFLDTEEGWAVDSFGGVWRWAPDRLGDVFSDGRVDLLDALVAARFTADGNATDTVTLQLLDLSPSPNGDGAITLADVAAVLRIAAGLEYP